MSTNNSASLPKDLNSINNNVVIENKASNTSSTTAHDGNFKRPNLELNLKPNEPKKEITCLMCSFSHTNVKEVEKHINSEHFDGTSPSVPKENLSSFNCPCCPESFQAYEKLESHVYYQHADVISPSGNSELKRSSTPCHKCPVCNKFTSLSSEELTVHVESHFTTSPVSPADKLVAQKLSIADQENLQMQQQREFEFLQAQYGMDNKGNFKEQSIKNMQKAVYSGELTVMDFYEKQNELKIAENIGLDDGSSCVKGIIPNIKAKSESCENISRRYFCFNMDFYSVTYGDRGWGCGYRNLQMLISSLRRNATYSELINMQLCSKFGMEKMYGMPCISKLQQLIEWAWEQGFDEEGREQLGSKLYNTKKWIGATEVVTLLSALRFRCSLVDCHRPNEKGQHPKMFEWISKYFQTVEEFKAPLYLQHDGHSQTVIGIEILRDGEIFLLIVDPATPRRQMEKLLSNNANALGFIRKSLYDMKSDQYQIATVNGVITSEEEYQDSKKLRSHRIM